MRRARTGGYALHGAPASSRGTAAMRIMGVAAACLTAVALAACAPQGQSAPSKAADSETDQPAAAAAPTQEPAEKDAGAAADTTSALESMGYADFLEPDSGIYPESYYTKTYMNSGKRGCNSCHENLWDKVNNVGNLVHLASSKPGYGKNANWMDCYGCHQGGADQGPSLFDAIHSAHYSNPMFVEDLHGTCFNCHAINSKGQYVVWDLYRYGSEFGGMLNAGSQNIQDWVGNRGFSQDTIAGITLQADMPVEVKSLEQPVSSFDDHFSASNHAVPKFDVENWTLKIKGVNDEREFTRRWTS